MASTVTDRLFGENSSVAVKAPVVAVVTANIVLSGLQTLPNGYTTKAGDRILVAGNADPTTNGIYNANTSTWTRTGDFDANNDVVQGTLIVVYQANGQALIYQLLSANPVIFGSSALTFTPLWQPPNVTYPQTATEALAGVAPANTAFPPPNQAGFKLERYGGDSTGVADNAAAFASLFKVMLAANGSAAILPPGTYNLATTVAATITPAVGSSSATHGISLIGYGAVINYTGNGYAFDITSPSTAATFYQPTFCMKGINITCGATAQGGIRVSDASAQRYQDVFVFGATNGTAFTLQNLVNWSENVEFLGCGAVNCQVGMAFVKNGGQNSFSRTTVLHFFCAGISNFWFDVGPGCSVYDSRFEHISGNFGSLACFAIGSAATGGDMTGTVVDGIDFEVNSSPAGQAVFRLRDYPQNAGVARRPVVYNVQTYATSGGAIPLWGGPTGAAVNVEPVQIQPLIASTGLQAYEANYGINAPRPVATYDTGTITPNVSLTGYAAPPSGRVTWERTGTLVTLRVLDPLIAVSNANTMTLTGLPPELTPGNAVNVLCTVQDNGVVTVPALASVNTNGTITFSIATAFNNYSSTGFTAAGQKGLLANTTITYSL